MKRALGLMFAVTLLAGVAASCGDDEKSDSGSATTEASSSSDSSSSDSSSSDSSSSDSSGKSDTGNAKVDAYCNEVDDVVAALEKVKDDPTSADAQAASQQAQELSSKATALVGELISDPDLASAVTDCTKKLQSVGG
jgi:hypothetical protein